MRGVTPLLIALTVTGCIGSDPSDPVGSISAASGVPVACWIQGCGTINTDPGVTDAIDAFGGEVHPEGIDPAATGGWVHVTSTGDRFVGDATELRCRSNGGFGGGPGSPGNLSDIDGTGSWNG